MEVSAIFYPDIFEILRNYEQKGSKYGLERTRALLDMFSSPDEKLKIVHIAGSNGKGSVAAFITNILVAAGFKVGTFTSPEVYSYAEKFLFDNSPAEDYIKYYLSEVYSAAMKMGDKPTAFEIETVAALAAFASCGCEYAVVECGLGGRDDATNAIKHKSLAVITSVSLEHTAILGDTIEEICEKKAGIIKDCPVVVSALQSESGRKFLSRYTQSFAGDGLEIVSRSAQGSEFTYKGGRYFIGLCGDAQCYNAATAIDAAGALGIGGCRAEAGLVLTKLKGRCEILKAGGRTYILDGAHNPAAFAPLLDVLRGMEGRKSLVFGCLSDKDVEQVARAISQEFEKVLAFSPHSYRAMGAEQISSAFLQAGCKDVRICADVQGALCEADGDIIAVCGSFTILKEAKQWIEKRQ